MFGENRWPLLRSALVIDTDPLFLELIKNDDAYKTWEPMLINSGLRAQSVIRDPRFKFGVVFLGANTNWPCAISLIKLIHQYHPLTPIYLTYSGEQPLTSQEAVRVNAQLVTKDKNFTQLMEISKVSAVNLAVPPPPPSFSEATREFHAQEGFTPVLIEELVGTGYSPFDLYARVPTGKFLQISQAEEYVSQARLEKYLKSGARYLYVRTASLQQRVSYCDSLAKNMMKSQNVSSELKLLYAACSGEAFMAEFLISNMDDTQLDQGFDYLNRLQQLVEMHASNPEPLLKAFLNNAHLIEHSVCVSLLCAMMAKKLGIQTAHTFRQLGLAALFHDIGLMQMPEHLRNEDPASFTEEEVAKYKEHPRVSAEVISRFTGVEEATVQAVRQHHVRRNGSGFPEKVSAGDIHLFSEMIGISDEYCRLLLKRRFDPKIKPMQVMERKIFSGFSSEVVEAFSHLIQSINTEKNEPIAKGKPLLPELILEVSDTEVTLPDIKKSS